MRGSHVRGGNVLIDDDQFFDVSFWQCGDRVHGESLAKRGRTEDLVQRGLVFDVARHLTTHITKMTSTLTRTATDGAGSTDVAEITRTRSTQLHQLHMSLIDAVNHKAI